MKALPNSLPSVVQRSFTFICALLLLFFYGPLQAQTLPSRSGSVSDQQLMQLYQQAQKAGMSDADISSMLMQQGLSSSEVQAFQKRIVNSQGKLTGPNAPAVGGRDTMGLKRDTVWVKEAPQPKRPLNFYGFDFFNTPNRSFTPNLQIATPQNYVLGPGDELIVTITGVNQSNFSNKITPEGTLLLPYAGVVHVGGLTIEQAISRIKTRLQVPYPALASGKSQLQVTLGNIRTIHVSIVGEAERQGTYEVSNLAGFFNVLYLSGGPSANGSLRNIELIRNNKVIEKIDFYSFLQKGVFEKDLRLEDQDIIRFPVYTKRVSLSGEVKHPAVFELKDKETLSDLLTYAGGFSDKAYAQKIKLEEIGTQEKRVRDVAAADFSYFIPKNGDSAYVEPITTSRFENRVILQGAVNRPGTYELSEGLTVKQLLNQAAGLRDDAFLNRGYIKRWQPAGSPEMLSFNTRQLLLGAQPDITLAKEDSVFILSRDDVSNYATISIGGAVRTPGTFTYRKGMRLQDVIAMAGGFDVNAASHRVEVSRMEKNTADTLANQLVKLITLNVDSSLQQADSRFELAPLDYIFVPQLLNYRVLGNIKIRGEVLFPGDYALERRDETVQGLVTRAGGLSPFASAKDIQVYRNGLRVGTNILSNEQAEKDKFLLLPTDSIFVPRNQSYVEVSGYVFNQQIVSYNGSRFLYYISAAGGVTDNGKLKKAYVQYSNGLNKKIGHFLFFRRYPKVLPGSKIIVPQKSFFDRSAFLAAVPAYSALLTALIAVITVFKN